MLLCRSSGFCGRRVVLAEEAKDLPCAIALEAAHDLRLRLSLPRAAPDVVDGGLVEAHACDDDAVERGVGLAVAASVQPVAGGAAPGRPGRGGAAPPCGNPPPPKSLGGVADH